MPGLMMQKIAKAPGQEQVAMLKGAKRNDRGVKESPEQVTAPVAFSSKPGKAAMLAYITPDEAALLRSMGQGYSRHGSGEEVVPGKRQHKGPRGLLSFNGEGGYGGPAADDDDGPGGPAGTKSSDDYGGMDPSPQGYGDQEGAASNSDVAPGWGAGTAEGWDFDPARQKEATKEVGTIPALVKVATRFGMLPEINQFATDVVNNLRARGIDVKTGAGGKINEGFDGGVESDNLDPGEDNKTMVEALLKKNKKNNRAAGSTDATKEAAKEIQAKGRDGDTILAHISPQEVNELKAAGGRGTRNPRTGLLEFAKKDNFDAGFYKSQNADLSGMSDDQLWKHYEDYGKSEGRVANQAEKSARDKGYKGKFGSGQYRRWQQSQKSQKELSATTPKSPYTKKEASAASNLEKILASDSPLMKRAASQGLMTANRRGLLNSSIAAEAAQAAMIDKATPIARQDADQASRANLSNQQFKQQDYLKKQDIKNQQWLARLDADMRAEIAKMQDNTRRSIANMNVGSQDKQRISAMVSEAQRVYANQWSNIVGNKDIPADQRAKYFTHIQNALKNQINLIEGMYGVKLDWKGGS